MKIGERGQVTVPKKIRDRFGLRPGTRVQFDIIKGVIVLRKAELKLTLRKWQGSCAGSLKKLGFTSVDDFIEAVRGR
jgi:AbrB family looped-hinge helix DNA binding protein